MTSPQYDELRRAYRNEFVVARGGVSVMPAAQGGGVFMANREQLCTNEHRRAALALLTVTASPAAFETAVLALGVITLGAVKAGERPIEEQLRLDAGADLLAALAQAGFDVVVRAKDEK